MSHASPKNRNWAGEDSIYPISLFLFQRVQQGSKLGFPYKLGIAILIDLKQLIIPTNL